jgi:DNA-binding MarR family transcriptional regulator
MTRAQKRRAALVAQLGERKQRSVGQLLLRAARLYNERAMGRVQARVPQARLAHTTLLPHIDFEGTRLVEIARRAGVTKQAVSPLVDEMVQLGMLRRERDPEDARAQRVSFTEAGLEQLIAGIDVLDALERELAGQVGAATMARLCRALTKLVPALERAE